MTFVLALLKSRPYQEMGSFAGGSNNQLNPLAALNARFWTHPGGLQASRNMAEALVLPAFLLTQLFHLYPCRFSSSFWIHSASRCRAVGSSGKVNAAPDQTWKMRKHCKYCIFGLTRYGKFSFKYQKKCGNFPGGGGSQFYYIIFSVKPNWGGQKWQNKSVK